MGLHAAIMRLSPLTHEGEQRYKPYIVVDPRMVTPPLKNPGYAPVNVNFSDIFVRFMGGVGQLIWAQIVVGV